MQYDKVADDALIDRVDRWWGFHKDTLKPELFNALDSHVETVEGYNRGGKSVAYTVAHEGPSGKKMKLRLQNTASAKTICHEIGHALMDSLGIDTTQEATNRASNKQNGSRWPQFSFGKKDSPVERFLLRRYGDLPNLTLHQSNESDVEEYTRRSDIWFLECEEPSWCETLTYDYTHDNREWKRRVTPLITVNGEPAHFNLKKLGLNRRIKVRLVDGESLKFDGVKLVDRYELTPGLAAILDVDVDVELDTMGRLLYELNTHWFDAITLVRKRGDKKMQGRRKCVRTHNSYYIMNTHEYFAELHADMMVMLNTDTVAVQKNIDRLRKTCPGLIEAYEEALIKE